MMKKVKKGSAVIALLALVLSTVVIPKAYAALAVDTSKNDCSVELNVANNVGTFTELDELPVTVNLYKVADISASGKYTGVGDFESLTFDEIDDKTTAEMWEEKANAAVALVKEATATVLVQDGKGTATGLETGMYLVVPEETKSDDYAYTFKPYLVSLPSHYDDIWRYNLTGDYAVGLKPEATDLYGDLVITKELTTYNATVGGATFVFQVEATKDYSAIGGEEKVVYSDVVMLEFDAAGQQSITIDNLPAGAEVTVTEVYSGGSYEATEGSEFTVTIIADEVVSEETLVATVTFTNEYNGNLNGGSGVINHFEKEGNGWGWTKVPANNK